MKCVFDVLSFACGDAFMHICQDDAIAIGFDASAQQQPASQERGGESERDSVSDWVASMMQ